MWGMASQRVPINGTAAWDDYVRIRYAGMVSPQIFSLAVELTTKGYSGVTTHSYNLFFPVNSGPIKIRHNLGGPSDIELIVDNITTESIDVEKKPRENQVR